MRILFTLLALSVCSIVQTDLKAQVNLSNGLVASFPFDGDANDASGAGYTGTVVGATLTTDRFGNANKAFSFNGTSKINTNFQGVLGTNPRSISAWIKLETDLNCYAFSYGAGYNGLPTQYGGNFNCGFGWGPNSENSIGSKTVVIEGNDVAIGYKFDSIRNSKWHHVVWTLPNIVNPTFESVLIYVDGVLLNTKVNPYNVLRPLVTYSNSPLIIGNHPLAGNYGFKGCIDDIKIYNRGLNSDEIKALYSENSSQLNERLIAYYPFNGNFKDYSNNGNHLTTIIGTQFATNRYGAALNALSFAGGDNRVLAPSSPSLNSVTNGMSMSLWIYQTSANCFSCTDHIPNYGYNIVSKLPSGQNEGGYGLDARGYNQSPNITGRKMRFMAGTGTTVSAFSDTEDAVDYSLNQWHHLVVTYDLSTVKYYLDNILTTTVTSHLDSISKNNFNLAIGGSADDTYTGIGFNYKGLIDEVRIYNRVINTQEVNALYNAYEVEILSVCQPTTVTSIVQSPASKFGFYTINYDTKDLIFVDTLGNTTKVGNTFLGSNQWKYKGMDFDKAGNLYYIGSNDSLYQINQSSGKATFISKLKDPNDNLYPLSNAMSFSPNGNMYILTGEGKLRKVLNIGSGLATSLGSNLTGLASTQCLEFDDSGTIWTLDECCVGKLHKLSTSTGANIFDSPQLTNQSFPSELDFSNGKLYGISIYNETTSTVTTFYSVNRATGSTTNLFTLPGIHFGLAGQIRKMYPDTVYITKHDTVVVTKNQTVTIVSFITVTGLNTAGEREDSDIRAFPNPATNKLSVTSETGAVYSAELIDSKGVPLLTSFSPSNIDLGDKAKGIYILKAKGFGGTVLKTFKVMIE